VRDETCDSCGRSNPGLWGYGPLLRRLGADFGFAPFVVGTCSLLYVLTLLGSGTDLQMAGGGLSILSPSSRALLLFGMSGAYPVFSQGSWWTLLSASWLHGSLLHIFFNMMWVRSLGPATADVIGASRTVIIYVVAGACGFLLSSVAGLLLRSAPVPFFLHGAFFTMGASASIFGLFGALVHYGRMSGSSLIRSYATRYAVLMFIFGLFMPGIDNYAHAGGFLGGYAMSVLFNPLTRERGDHLLVAFLCLGATFLSIVASVLLGLGLFR